MVGGQICLLPRWNEKCMEIGRAARGGTMIFETCFNPAERRGQALGGVFLIA